MDSLIILTANTIFIIKLYKNRREKRRRRVKTGLKGQRANGKTKTRNIASETTATKTDTVLENCQDRESPMVKDRWAEEKYKASYLVEQVYCGPVSQTEQQSTATNSAAIEQLFDLQQSTSKEKNTDCIATEAGEAKDPCDSSGSTMDIKTGTSEVGAKSEAQKARSFKIVKGGPFGLFEIPVCCKISKRIEGGTLGTLKNFQKNLTKPKKGTGKVS